MPRKSTPSVSAADTAISTPSNADGLNAPALDGDASMLSVATDASTTTTTTTTTKPRGNGKAAKEDTDSVGLDDLLLPRTLISRLARGILPANTSIQKDALLALTKAATVFISHLAHNANELTQKKTVGPQDVLKALEEIEMAGVMGLGHVGPDGKVGGRLERELEIFENVVKGKRKGYREKVKARESGGGNMNNGRADGDGNGERGPKRARFEEDDGQDAGQQAGGVPATTRTSSLASPHQYPRQQQQTQLTAMAPSAPGHAPKDDMPLDDDESQDENDGSAPDEEGDELRSEEEEEDDDDDGDEDEGEEEEREERPPEEDDLEGYGPDDQLRHDLDGGDDDDDDDDSD